MTPQELIAKGNFYQSSIEDCKRKIEEAKLGFYLDFKCFFVENRSTFRTIEVAKFFKHVIKNGYKELNRVSANVEKNLEIFNIVQNLDWLYKKEKFAISSNIVSEERVIEYLKNADLNLLVRKLNVNVNEIKVGVIKIVEDEEEVGKILTMACSRDLDLSYEEFMEFTVYDIKKEEYEKFKVEVIRNYFIKLISFINKKRSDREIYSFIKEKYELSNYLKGIEILDSIKIAKTIQTLGE